MSGPLTLKAAVLRWVAEAFPALFYSAPRTYLVHAVRSDKRLDLTPPPDASWLPELPNVEQWTGAGELATPAVGADVTVFFRDANPTRPVAIGWGPGTPIDTSADASGTVALGASSSAVHLAHAAGAVVRHGDTVAIAGPGSAAGIITVTSGTAEFPPVVSKVKA
jgi:hypothetical protein